jgi:Carboxypeptidase regulatory-like domain
MKSSSKNHVATALRIVLGCLTAGLLVLACKNPAVGGGGSSEGSGDSGGSGTISGTITIASYPVQGVTVTIGSASATTDSSGNYTITGLANGSYTVTPSKTN